MAEKIEIAKVQLGLDTSTFEQQFQNLISKFPNDIMKLFDALNKYSGTKNIGESLFREPIQKAIEQSKKDYQNFAEFVADINRQITDQSLKFTYNTKAGRATIGGTGYKSSDLATITKEVEKVITAQKTKTTPADKKSTSNNADALNRTLTQTVDNLNTTVQNLNSASSSLNTSATNIGNSASALGTANANLGNTSQSISGASATLNTAAQAVSNAANALSGAAQNTGNPSTNSSTGGGNTGGSGGSSTASKDPRARLAEFNRNTAEGLKISADASQKADAAIINARKRFDEFKKNYSNLFRQITGVFDDTGNLVRANARLRISGRESANITLSPEDIQEITNRFGKTPQDVNPKALNDMLLSRGGTSSLSRTYVDEVSQVERYKALLTEEYDLRLKLYEAEANEDNLLQNKIRYQLEINNIQKSALNAGRVAGGRDPIFNGYGNAEDPESVSFLNRQLQERNQNIQRAIQTRTNEDNVIKEQIQLEQELTNLVSERTRLESKLSGQTTGSQKFVTTQNRLNQVNTQIEAYNGRIPTDTYNRITSSDTNAQQQNLVAKLTRLENERYQAWQKSRSAMQKGNTEEATEYQRIARAKLSEYNTELRSAENTQLLTNRVRELLNNYIEYNQILQRVTSSKEKDVQRQKQENEVYSKATKSLQEYVELRREQGKLTNKAGKGDKGIYTAAYQNVQDKMSAITGTSGLGNLIDFSSGQMSLKSFNATLGITREQYEKLRTVVAEANATIKDDAIKAKQESDLATLNKMITAYTNLKKAQSTLQEYKARAYNDATVNQQQAVVDRLQAQYNALLKDNDALAKTSTYTNMVAEANAKMADNVTRSNQSNSKQLTLLERLKASFQRTAAVAFSFNIFNRLFMEMRQGLSNVIEKTKEFDKTMTEVQMVTNQTDTSVRKTLASYSELAKELGTTTDAVAKGNLEWLRQGKSAEDSAKLIRASTMMSTLGAMESSEATQKLTAWVRAGYIVIYIKINSFNCGKILRAYYTNL